MRSETLECFSRAFSRFTAPLPPPPPRPPPPPSSMPGPSGGFWMRPSGEESGVTGLWRCGGFGGTRERTSWNISACIWMLVDALKFFPSSNVSLQCGFGSEGGGVSYPSRHHTHTRHLNCTKHSKCDKPVIQHSRE